MDSLITPAARALAAGDPVDRRAGEITTDILTVPMTYASLRSSSVRCNGLMGGVRLISTHLKPDIERSDIARCSFG